jgi:hypothetical protein
MLSMQFVGIVLLCIGAAVVYGILHDQITARVCVEYFTIGHPDLFHTNDPTLLGIGWGIIATWWVGLLLGIPLAIVARAGPRTKRSALSLLPEVTCLLVIMAGCALAAGALGWVLASADVVILHGWMAQFVPIQQRIPFIADAWTHSASYLAGFGGGIAIIVRVGR